MSDFGPRDTLNEVLENLHGSLKWFWLVVMAFAMEEAVANVSKTLFESSERRLFPLALFCGAFAPAFVRFFFGDNRYLDMRYLEHRKFLHLTRYLSSISETITTRSWWMDIVFLMLHGIIFVVLARLLTRPQYFFEVYVALLLLNFLYLGLSRWASRASFMPLRLDLQPRDDGPPWWMANNIAHAFLMVDLLAWALIAPLPIWPFPWPGPVARLEGMPLQSVLLLVTCATNSYIDFAITARWYFPTLDTALDASMRGVPIQRRRQKTHQAPGTRSNIRGWAGAIWTIFALAAGGACAIGAHLLFWTR